MGSPCLWADDWGLEDPGSRDYRSGRPPSPRPSRGPSAQELLRSDTECLLFPRLLLSSSTDTVLSVRRARHCGQTEGTPAVRTPDASVVGPTAQGYPCSTSVSTGPDPSHPVTDPYTAGTGPAGCPHSKVEGHQRNRAHWHQHVPRGRRPKVVTSLFGPESQEPSAGTLHKSSPQRSELHARYHPRLLLGVS